jgi:hypothetical protein
MRFLKWFGRGLYGAVLVSLAVVNVGTNDKIVATLQNLEGWVVLACFILTELVFALANGVVVTDEDEPGPQSTEPPKPHHPKRKPQGDE